MNWLKRKLESLFKLMELSAYKKVWRLIFGSIGGIFFAGIAWSYTIFFHIDIPLTQGIIGSLLMALTFGLISAYGDLDRFFESFPPIL